MPEEQKNTFLKGYIDELIASPNQAEKEVYDEIAYNELVIKLEGDVTAAKEQFDAEQTKKANDLNLIAEMIDWIYERESQEVNGQIKLSMFTLTKMLQEKAAESHVEDYRARRKNNYAATLGEYSTTVNFKREDEEYDKIKKFYTEKKDAELATIKAWRIHRFWWRLLLLSDASCWIWSSCLNLGGAGWRIQASEQQISC